MEATILHSGFDGLKFTVQADIPDCLREELASAKQHAKETYGDCVLEFGTVSLNVTSKGARGFTAHSGDHGAVWLFQDPQDRVPNNPGITPCLWAGHGWSGRRGATLSRLHGSIRGQVRGNAIASRAG